VDPEESQMSNDDVTPDSSAPQGTSDADARQEDAGIDVGGQAPGDAARQWPAPDHTTQVLDPDSHLGAATQTTTEQMAYAPAYAPPDQAPQEQYPQPGADGYLPPPPGVAPQTADRPPRAEGVGKYIAVAAVTGLLAGVAGGAFGYSLADSTSTSSSVSIAAPSDSENLSARAEGSIAAIAADVLPSVVSLEVSGGGQAGSGSGFVVSEDGYVLTNNHVIEAAADGGSIEVVLSDDTRLRGELVGRNADYDLAVVKVNRTGLQPVQIGDSGSVAVGDQAVAIGSPLGLEGTVTSGIISALDRPVTAGGDSGGETSFINAIQTDAPINPGNSGGPLVNAEGQVIGVNSAIASLGQIGGGQPGSIGLGFAIPINTANRIAQEVIRTGSSATPIIGAEIDFTYDGRGARVQAVTPGGPAARAGLKDGAVIVAVNGETVDDAVSLITSIRKNAPGDEITLSLQDGSEISVTLGQR
jgi:putative serine protease PepD